MGNDVMLEKKLEILEQKISFIEEKMEQIEKRFTIIEGMIKENERKLEGQRISFAREIGNLKIMLGIIQEELERKADAIELYKKKIEKKIKGD